MRKLVIFIVSVLFIGCASNSQNVSVIKDPYKKSLSNSEKVAMLTNQLINKDLNAHKPKRPIIPKAKTLVKGEFEKTVEFNQRVAIAQKNRKELIDSIVSKYKAEVQIYNSYKQKNIDRITKESASKALATVYGKPTIKNLKYDADSETFFGELVSLKGNFREKIAIKIPRNEAREYKKVYHSISPKIIFDMSSTNLSLKEIRIPFKKRTYLAMLTDTTYNKNVKVTIDRGVVKNDLIVTKDDYEIKKVVYKKGSTIKRYKEQIKRVETTQGGADDLPEILANMKQSQIDNNKFAIVIGISDYMETVDVPFADNSADMFAKFATTSLGVPSNNIYKLINQKATSGQIRTKIKYILNQVDNNSIVYFYFAGHGVPTKSGKPFILPSDMSASMIEQDKSLMLQNIYDTLSHSKAKKVVAFIDSCFSGKDDKGDFLYDGVGALMLFDEPKIENKMTIFTAGERDQFSNQYKKRSHRLFSYFLLKGISKGLTNSKKLYDFIKENVLIESKKIGLAHTQIPKIYGNSGDIK